ncbi:MAG: ferritin-like domain-containing protein [Actinomycetota bacterium]|nr:ferritin-like domain-containing protein [Actinomycetota bacterium]
MSDRAGTGGLAAARVPTRRELLVAGAGAAVTSTLLAPGAAHAAGVTTAPEAPAYRLHRLLRVELLVVYCYEHVLSASLLRPRARRLLLPLHGHEQAHVHLLEAELRRLGGTPPAPPASIKQANRDLARHHVGGRLGQLQGSRDALFLLLALEQVSVGAYYVALTKLTERRLITLAAQIMASEAQHEALIGLALNPGRAQNAVPYGFVQGIR